MKLNEYQWSHNPRGMHNEGPPAPLPLGSLIKMKMGWCKLVVIDREYRPAIAPLIQANITPIIRIYRPQPGAAPFSPDNIRAVQVYVNEGARWFEFVNEPNFDIEWPANTPPSYTDTAGTIGPLMVAWMDWAEYIIGLGAYPAFPAMGPHVGGNGDAVSFMTAMLRYAQENFYDRFRNIAASGMWVATHPYFFNHYYQEATGPLDPRQPDQQNADQGGWHFEYPFDPISQADQPGITTVSGPPSFPTGDPIGLTAMGHAFMLKFGEMFGGGAVPVVATEGGITPNPVNHASVMQADSRYPPVTWRSHGEGTLAAFNWIAEQGPPWMFGLNLWKENEYEQSSEGPIPAVARLTNSEPIYKTVPAIDALDGAGPGDRQVVVLPGPGPIHGTPDYHFLILAPGFDTNWFFSAARDYWDKYRPTVLSATDFIAYLPTTRSLATTVLSTPDLVDYMSHHIKDRWPNVYFDLIVAEDTGTIADALAQRVTSGRRFG